MTKDLMKKLEKVVINVGVGKLSSQPNFSDKLLPAIAGDLSIITGQKPAPRPAKKSISGFKLRQGMAVGLKVTLRRDRMAQFLAKVIGVVLPRVRDFRGLSPKNVDKEGIFSFGLRDYLVFPEVAPEASKVNFGVEITVVPKQAQVKSRDEALVLYKELGIPFIKATGDKKQATR